MQTAEIQEMSETSPYAALFSEPLIANPSFQIRPLVAASLVTIVRSRPREGAWNEPCLAKDSCVIHVLRPRRS